MPQEAAQPETSTTPSAGLESRILAIGEGLLTSLEAVLDQVPEAGLGPQKLAGALGIDKALTSRLLKAMRSHDALTAMHRIPGPDPLRRVLKAAVLVGVDPALIAAARESVDTFEKLIQVDTGDRSALGTILSAWVPEARRDFEMRRKQAAFKAMSQIKGVEIDLDAETAIFVPNADGLHLDVVWIRIINGLRRLRPGAPVNFSSSKFRDDKDKWRQTNLDGDPIDSVTGTVVPEFSTNPVPRLDVRVAGLTAHYLLGETDYGASSAVDLVSCEVNRALFPRYMETSRNRRFWAAMTIGIPARASQFDVIVHEDVFRGESPELRIYDTAGRGDADVNDPTRDIDLLDLLASVETLGTGVQRFGSSDVPRYRQIITHVMDRLGLDGEQFRGFRVSSECPVYGSQTSLSFKSADPPPGATA